MPDEVSNCRSGSLLSEEHMLAPLQTSGTVLCNVLRGHKRVYDAIKSMPGGEATAVGIVHNVFWLEPKGDGLGYSHVKCAAYTPLPPALMP